MDIVRMIKELFELYDDYGSEMPDSEINFIRLLLTKAQKGGLHTELLASDEFLRIQFLHRKYSKIESFDSSESDSSEGL